VKINDVTDNDVVGLLRLSKRKVTN